MPRFCANVTMLYNEVDFLDRFEAAAKSGFKGVEYLFPYAYPAAQLRERLDRHQLVQVLHNLPAGDWAKGERGIACHPDRIGEFQDGVGKAIEYATALGCKQVNCLAGIAPPGVTDDKLRATFVANLRFAAPKLADAGIKLLVEPINTRDIPGFYLTHTKQAVALIQEVGSPNLFVQYDIYHMQIMEGDLARTIEENLIADRAPAARRQPRPQRAGHRRDQLSVSVRLDRPPRLPGLDRVRIQAEGEDDRRSRLARRPSLVARRNPKGEVMKIAFIGLGIMGAPMAGHLIKAGHEVWLSDIKPVPVSLVEAGGKPAKSAKEAAEKADFVIIMVPDTPHVESALFGELGDRRRTGEGQDRDRHELDLAARDEGVRARITELGCDYLDAPVSGGEVGAKAASLTIMVGGTEQAFEKVRPILELMGKNITLVGGVGDGQTCKVANQIIVGAHDRSGRRGAALRIESGRRPGEGAAGADGRLRQLASPRSAMASGC